MIFVYYDCSEWQGLEANELVLGKVSSLFLKKTVSTLYGHLKILAQNLSLKLENLKAFYQLLFLLTLEFSEPGVLDMVAYLNWVQDQATRSDSSFTVGHRSALHAIIAGILYLISKISQASGLQEHILQVLQVRRVSAPYLMPARLFSTEDQFHSKENSILNSQLVDKSLIFILDEELLRKSPEQKKGFGKEGCVCFRYES